MNKDNFFKGIRATVLVFAMFLLAGCGQVELLSNLPEKEANEIVSIMQQNNISVSKKSGVELTWTIMLNNSAEFSRAVEVLSAKGYPNIQYNTIGQVFQKSGLVSSPLEERARFMYALSENIAETLSQIPGVLTSRVHIVLPESDAYSDSETEASAAIFLTYRAGGNLDESVREIKYLVANSVQGLDYDRVSIALFPVAFDQETSADGAFETNVHVIGLSMTSDSAAAFLIILIILLGLLLCATGAAAYFFLEIKKAKKSSESEEDGNAPVVVQQEDPTIDELDEAPEETTEER